jgi:hypothetical protein
MEKRGGKGVLRRGKGRRRETYGGGKGLEKVSRSRLGGGARGLLRRGKGGRGGTLRKEEGHCWCIGSVPRCQWGDSGPLVIRTILGPSRDWFETSNLFRTGRVSLGYLGYFGTAGLIPSLFLAGAQLTCGARLGDDSGP